MTINCSKLVNIGLIILLLIGSLKVDQVTTIKCFVCDSNDGCKKFYSYNTSNYTKECSAPYQSCGIQIKGDTIVSQSCESIKIDDCKMANNIEYCYCTYDLCNGNKSTKGATKFNRPSDDEDIVEGSGYNEIPTTFHLPNENKTVLINGVGSSSRMYYSFIFIVCCYFRY